MRLGPGLRFITVVFKVVLREVVLRHKPPSLLQCSPKGTVPVLILPHGQVIDESYDIMLFALQHHDPDQWLKGLTSDKTSGDRGVNRALMTVTLSSGWIAINTVIGTLIIRLNYYPRTKAGYFWRG